MLRPSVHHRRGMSLVELLVVVAILGLLAVTVLPTIASTTESRRTREAARIASAFMASAQTRAIGRREWSGFRVLPAAGNANVAIDMISVDQPPAYRGDTLPATITITDATSDALASGTASSGSLFSAGLLNISAGNLIRFNDRDPWYKLGGPPSDSLVELKFNDSAGKGATTTPWPPTGQPLTFEIALSASQRGAPVALGEGRVIDIRGSGVDDSGSGFEQFLTGPIDVLFDGTGRVRRVTGATGTRPETDQPGAIFFLIGRADRAVQTNPDSYDANDDTSGCNWQWADSIWVMIAPANGAVYTAACKPGQSSPLASQEWVRQFLSTTGGS